MPEHMLALRARLQMILEAGLANDPLAHAEQVAAPPLNQERHEEITSRPAREVD
jgi:hypothetical protein